MAIEHEVSSVKELQALRVKEFAELERRGLKAVALKPDAGRRFAEGAREASYQRMKERMEKAGGRQEAERFIKLFAPAS